MLEKVSKVVVEGDVVAISLNQWVVECMPLFDWVIEWAGLLECRTKLMDDLWAQIQHMNQEVKLIIISI